MKETQCSLMAISNKKKEINFAFQSRISNFETKLHNMQDLFKATKNRCHTGMTFELRSKKMLAPLEVKKKRIKEKQNTVQLEEPLREQDPDEGTSRKETRVEENKPKDPSSRTKIPYPHI